MQCNFSSVYCRYRLTTRLSSPYEQKEGLTLGEIYVPLTVKYLSRIRPFIPFSFSKFWLMNKKGPILHVLRRNNSVLFPIIPDNGPAGEQNIAPRTKQHRFTTTRWHRWWNMWGIYQQLFENTYIFQKLQLFHFLQKTPANPVQRLSDLCCREITLAGS